VKKLRFWLNFGIGLAIAAFFLWLFFRSVKNWGELWDSLLTARYIFIVPAILISLATFIFRALRWHYLLYGIKRIPSLRLFSPMLIGFMGNCLLPARAGEFIRAYLLAQRENIKLTASLATLVVDRMFDMFVLLLLIAGVLLFYPLDETVLLSATGRSLEDIRFFLGVVATSAFAGLVGFILLLYYKKDAAARILSAVLFFLPSGVRQKIVALFVSFTEGLHIFKNGRHVCIAVVISIAQWILGALMFYPLFFAFGIQEKLSLTSVAVVLAAASVGVSIPTPGYAGPFHFFVQVGLQLCDSSISDTTAKAYALVTHIATFFPVILIGIGFAFKEGISLAQMEKTSEQLKESVE